MDYSGKYHSARNSELVLRGPRPQGPPIIVAARGPRMLRLVAKYADRWSWWVYDHRGAIESLIPIVEELEKACEEAGRDPVTLGRCVDFYKVQPPRQPDGRYGGRSRRHAADDVEWNCRDHRRGPARVSRIGLR